MLACLASASVRDLCMLGDTRLTEETSKAFKKDKKITKVNKHIYAIIQQASNKASTTLYIIPGHRVPYVSVSEPRHLPLLAAGVRG